MKPEIIFDEATHTYLVDGEEVPSVTTILKPLTDRGYGKVNPSVLEYARNRGTAVHEALENFDLGGDLEAGPETEGYIRAYLDWMEVYRPTWTDVEQIVYEDELGYIGTLDRAGRLNGTEFSIVDIKTSNPTKEALMAVCMQTAAYAIAYPGRTEISRYALFLKADGTWRFQNCTEYESKYGFSGYDAWLKMLDYHKMITDLLERKMRK